MVNIGSASDTSDSDILYGENMFQVLIREFHDECELFKKCDEYLSGTKGLLRFSFRRKRSFMRFIFFRSARYCNDSECQKC